MKKSKQLISQHIVQHLSELNELSESVADLLQIDRSIHSLWISIKKNKLLIMTDDSLFATQLRFQQMIIRQHLNQKLLIKLSAVKIKVIAANALHHEERKRGCYHISTHAGNILSHIAEGIEDKEISACLKRLGA
jgi:hypothetical protein